MFFFKKKNTSAAGTDAGRNPFLPLTGEEIGSKKISVTSVEWRDGQQSLLATRIKTEDMIPILEKMDQVGYHCMEMWGGATFDVMIRYLDDDPWERIRIFKEHVKKTPLRMLLRGQNLIGYKQYPDDIVEKFVERAAANGIDIFLVFDGLNDVRNTETAIRAVQKAGKKAEANICYTISPVHNIAKYVQIAKDYAALGVTAIHVEDMAGMVAPTEIYEAIRAIKQEVNLPVHFQAHSTGGMADLCTWEAIRAGAEVIDCDVSSLSMGTSHPPVESMVAALRGTVYDTGLDLGLLEEINKYFVMLREKYSEFSSKFTGVNIGVLRHQIPGGMMSNLESQLLEMKAMDRLDEIFEECHRVQKDLGYPPLATPFAQMVGSCATFNVLMGRYKVIPKEINDYCRGLYGRTPGEIDPELMKKVLGDEKPNTERPGALIPPGWEAAKNEVVEKGIGRYEEDVLTYILFPQIGETFLRKRYHLPARA